MPIELVFDTRGETTLDRLLELQGKGIMLRGRPVLPGDNTLLNPLWTKFYQDGYETCVHDLERGGITSSNGNLAGDSVKTDIDMVLYSSKHEQSYFFKRSAEFTQNGANIKGNFN